MLITNEDIDSFNPKILFITHSQINKDNLPSTCYHCHDFVELSIVTSGEVNYNIEGTNYTLKKDDVMIFNPGVYHQTLVDEDTVSNEIHIGIGNLNIDSLSTNYIRALDGAPILTIKKYKKQFIKCCNEISSEQHLRQLGHSFILKSLVMKLLVILYREMDESSLPSTSQTNNLINNDNKATVQCLIDYMSHYYMNDLSLNYLSKIMYISPGYMSEIFKEETGYSPIQYLIKIRLHKAKELLSTSSAPIKEISSSIGYENAYYFSTLFKKHYGDSPSIYRDNLDK